MLEYLKKLCKRFIEFLQNKFFSTDKYDNIIQDLYNENLLNNDVIDIIKNTKINENDIDVNDTIKMYKIVLTLTIER